MTDVNITPTLELYGQLQWLTDHFNRALFDGQLPPTVITLQRSAHTAGHFSESRWRHIQGTAASELALNPTYFAQRPLLTLCQTIAHELCHLWQMIDGSASRVGYHNSAWAEKMEQIGLMPSSTGRPGGARTGQKMADFPIEGGAFLRACENLVYAQFALTWIDQGPVSPAACRAISNADTGIVGPVPAPLLLPLGNLFPGIDAFTPRPANAKKRKTKYQCPLCLANVWGRQGLALVCRTCGQDFEEIETAS